MSSPHKRYFAVGLKGWTQIRVAKRPPVAVTREAALTIHVRRGHYAYDGENDVVGHYVEHIVPRKLNMKVTIYEGGRTIKTLRSRSVAAALKAGVRDGGLMELLPEQLERLKEMNTW